MSKYSEFFLNRSSETIRFELFKFDHSNFSKTYYVVRNRTKGLTVQLENGKSQFFEYLPLSIKQQDTRENLDYGIKINFGDLGEILPFEFDRIQKAENFKEKVAITYWSYKSNDLTAPLFGPVLLQGEDFTFKKQGASFTAIAPKLNINGTGEVYTIDRFPMLRGFL